MARATLSLSKEPWGSVFPFTILFVVFTASSTQPLDLGYAMEDSLCLTHYVLRNSWNVLKAKGGPPLVLSSSGAPYIWNNCWQMDISLVVVAWPGSKRYKMSQPVSLSVQARYVWSPIWKRSMTICRNGQSDRVICYPSDELVLDVNVGQIMFTVGAWEIAVCGHGSKVNQVLLNRFTFMLWHWHECNPMDHRVQSLSD